MQNAFITIVIKNFIRFIEQKIYKNGQRRSQIRLVIGWLGTQVPETSCLAHFPVMDSLQLCTPWIHPYLHESSFHL